MCVYWSFVLSNLFCMPCHVRFQNHPPSLGGSDPTILISGGRRSGGGHTRSRRGRHTYIGREKKKKKEEEEEEEKKGEDRDKNATTYSLCTKKKQGEKKIN